MIETKKVLLLGSPGDKVLGKTFQECQNYIKDLTAFGWQTTEVIRESNGFRWSSNYQILARETTMPHYNEYRKLEMDYEDAKKQMKQYNSMEASTVFLLLLLLILPGVIYIAFKSNQKQQIEEHNQRCKISMQKAVYAAQNIK